MASLNQFRLFAKLFLLFSMIAILSSAEGFAPYFLTNSIALS